MHGSWQQSCLNVYLQHVIVYIDDHALVSAPRQASPILQFAAVGRSSVCAVPVQAQDGYKLTSQAYPQRQDFSQKSQL